MDNPHYSSPVTVKIALFYFSGKVFCNIC